MDKINAAAPVGSIDTVEFRRISFAYANAIMHGSVPESSGAWGVMIDHIDALLAARAAPGVPAPVASTEQIIKRASINRILISLRDGWGAKNDADQAISMLAELAPTPAAPIDRDREVLSMLARVLKYIDPHAVDATLARTGPMEDAYINTIARKCVERHLAAAEAAAAPLAVPLPADQSDLKNDQQVEG